MRVAILNLLTMSRTHGLRRELQRLVRQLQLLEAKIKIVDEQLHHAELKEAVGRPFGVKYYDHDGPHANHRGTLLSIRTKRHSGRLCKIGTVEFPRINADERDVVEEDLDELVPEYQPTLNQESNGKWRTSR